MQPTAEILLSHQEDTLKKFFSECESKFRFLEQKHGFSYLSGLAEYKKNCKIITPYRDQNLQTTFWALTRYEKDDIAFEISFSHQSAKIECFAHYGPILRFSLSEILIAGRRSESINPSSAAMHSEDTLTSVPQISETLQNNLDLLINPTSKMIIRAQAIRENRLEIAIRKNFNERIKALSQVAARAYREKNYQQVISLLEPYKDYLSSADLKKLHLAKKQFLS